MCLPVLVFATLCGRFSVRKPKKPEPVWATCPRCGGDSKKHVVLFEKLVSQYDPDGSLEYVDIHQLIECGGCEGVKYRQAVEGWDDQYAEIVTRVLGVHPTASQEKKRRPGTAADVLEDNWQEIVPPDVFRMYHEAHDTFNVGAYTLSTLGLRAVVEAVCLDRGLTDRDDSLEKKIDKLVSEGHLAKSQAEFLHTIRSFGNDAAHRMERPSERELETILEIIEGMLNTIYVLPSKNVELKARQAKRKAKANGK